MSELKPRFVRVDDFVAESLEAEANRLPPSERTRADILREQARIFRTSGNPRMVRVWEEPPQKQGPEDFPETLARP